MSCRSGKDGFTLLEVMVCLAIISIALTAFLTAITQNVQLESMNAETNVAVNAAGSLVETVQTMSFAELVDGAVASSFEASGLTSEGHTLFLTDSSGSRQVGHVTINTNPEGTRKTVEVAVTWRSATGSDRTIRLMTEVTDY